MSEHTCGGRGPVPCPPCAALGRQVAFVQTWRERNPDRVWMYLTCPLCGWAVSVRGTPRLGEIDQRLMEIHQRDHGQNWLDYLAAGSEEA